MIMFINFALENSTFIMIKSIRFKNFFSFKDCTVTLNNINALIGINGTGKSNFIKALQLLKATVTEGALPELILNQWGGFDAMFFAGNNLQYDSKVELGFEFDVNFFPFGNEPLYYYYITFNRVGSTQNYRISEWFYSKDNDGNVLDQYMRRHNGKVSIQTESNKTADSESHNIEYVIVNEMESCFVQLEHGQYEMSELRSFIKDMSVYGYFDTTAKSLIRKPMLPSGISPKLLSDGSNLPQILNRIKINSKSNYNNLIASLQAINPQYNGFDFNFIGNNIELMLDEMHLERSVHVTHISDGTLRYLCLLAIVHNPERGNLVCIDEPEIGLHPDMISEFVVAMNQVSDKTQFIISTHSEHILNNLSVENVLVCEKDDDNGTIVNTFRDKDYVEWASQYATGNLWRNGNLGGNRY